MARSTTNLVPAPLSPRKRVVATVRQWVREGRLSRGDMLPTEQDLCAELQASRGTVRAALQQLEKEGFLEGRAGNGRLRARVVSGTVARGAGLMANTIVLVTHVLDVDRPGSDQGVLDAIDIAVASAARAAGKNLLVLNGEAIDPRGMAQLQADPPMGVVVGGAVADYAAKRDVLLELVGKVPLVVNSGDPLWEGCDRVISDHTIGAYELTRWALERERTRLLCIMPKPPLHYWAHDRLAGYHRALSEAGVEPLSPVYLQHQWGAADHSAQVFETRAREVAGLLVDRLVPRPSIDGILAASDHMAYVVAAACRLCGVAVHDQVLVVGYDNATSCPERDYEPIRPAATVDKGNATVGRRMVEILLQRIDDKLTLPHQLVRTAPTLIRCQGS